MMLELLAKRSVKAGAFTGNFGFDPLGVLAREDLHARGVGRDARAVLGEEDRETAVSLSDLASVLRLNGDLMSAEHPANTDVVDVAERHCQVNGNG